MLDLFKSVKICLKFRLNANIALYKFPVLYTHYKCSKSLILQTPIKHMLYFY